MTFDCRRSQAGAVGEILRPLFLCPPKIRFVGRSTLLHGHRVVFAQLSTTNLSEPRNPLAMLDSRLSSSANASPGLAYGSNVSLVGADAP